MRTPSALWGLFLISYLPHGASHSVSLSSETNQVVAHRQVSNLASTLTVQYVSPGVYHFELAPVGSETAVNAAIASSAMVSKKGLESFVQNDTLTDAQRQQLLENQIKIDSQTLCATIKDKASNNTLTQICPSATGSGLTLDSTTIQNVYGLGEQFLTPGQPNGDWNHKVRTPGGKYGNDMVPYPVGVDGNIGMVGNAEFPVMYALGAGQINFAFFFDHMRAKTWNFKASPYTVTTTGTPLRWYVITGENLPALRSKYMTLVGHAPVPPKKALGMWVSEYGYKNWNDAQDKINTLRAHHMPVDGFVLDLYWFGTPGVGEKTWHFGNVAWDKINFSHAREKLAELATNQGIGVGLIEESYIDKNLPEYKILADRGYLVKTCPTCGPVQVNAWWGRGSMIDWTNPEAGAFWHDLKRQPLIDDGVLMHWTDLGEPETFNENGWYAGGDGMGHHDHAAVHNMYNFRWLESINGGFSRHSVKRRPFILSRSGTSGLQRLGAAMWSGDIGSNLKSLSAQLNAQMHLSLSGIDYYGSDVGGFHREDLQGDINEVYTRWFAHSAAFDIPLRPHTDNGTGVNSTAPDRVGDIKSNAFNLRQRYQLSPYYYSLAHRAYLYGEPVMPPLVYYYQNDPNVREIADEKLIGRDLLFATGATLGQNQRDVYLPAGNWVDYHTQKWYRSLGQWIKNVPETDQHIYRLPLFVKEGAIIPKMIVDDQTMNITGMRADGSKRQELAATIVTSPTPSEFTVFEDDGETIEYKNKAIAQTSISQVTTDKQTLISIKGTFGTYTDAPQKRGYVIEVITQGKQPQQITFNGKRLNALKNSGVDGLSVQKKGQLKVGWRQVNPNLVVVSTPAEDVKKLKSLVFQY